MKKVMLLIVALVLSPMAAQADTVNLNFVTDSSVPAKNEAIVAQGTYAFKGTSQIVFKVLGKTCTFVGSAQAIGPIGCNYWLTANLSTMTLSNPRAENNPGCTSPSNMLAACK